MHLHCVFFVIILIIINIISRGEWLSVHREGRVCAYQVNQTRLQN